MIVDSRWATIRVVRFSQILANAAWIFRSVWVSRADVACKQNNVRNLFDQDFMTNVSKLQNT